MIIKKIKVSKSFTLIFRLSVYDTLEILFLLVAIILCKYNLIWQSIICMVLSFISNILLKNKLKSMGEEYHSLKIHAYFEER